MAKVENINIDDVALTEKWLAGNSAAMETLILKYQNRIYNAILKICANPDDAAELTQETFVKVIENIGKFQQRSSFYTWAFRIAVNLTLNYCKRKVRIPFKSIDAENTEYDNNQKAWLGQFLADTGSPDPATVVQNKELCQLLINAIMNLQDAQRAIIVLRDIEGMNYAQIAEVLDIETGTVKSRLSRARSKLREILEAVSK